METKAPQVTAASAAPETQDTQVQAFPNRQVLGVLGRGGMGVVYKARHTILGRIEAIKLIKEDSAKNSFFIERFYREAKLLSQLSHPNVTAIYEAGEVGSGVYFSMEFVDGASLDDLLPTNMSAKEILRIFRDAMLGVLNAHSRGILHRDIKPANILVGKDGIVKVADFGLARLVDRSQESRMLTRAGQVLGTMDFMAPEQFESPDTVTEKADVYSFAVALYFSLERKLPRWPLVLSGQNNIHPLLNQTILDMLEQNPDSRKSLKAAIDNLNQILSLNEIIVVKSGPAVSSSAPTVVAQVTRKVPDEVYRSWPRTLCLMAVFLILAVFNLYFDFSPKVIIEEGYQKVIAGELGKWDVEKSDSILLVPTKLSHSLSLPGLVSAVADGNKIYAITSPAKGEHLLVVIHYEDRSPRLKGFPLDSRPTALSRYQGSVFIAVEKEPASIYRIDPMASKIEKKMQCPHTPRLMSSASWNRLIAVFDRGYGVLDTESNRIKTIDTEPINSVASKDGLSYLASDSRIVLLVAENAAVTKEIREGAKLLFIKDDSLWAVSQNLVVIYDADLNRVSQLDVPELAPNSISSFGHNAVISRLGTSFVVMDKDRVLGQFQVDVPALYVSSGSQAYLISPAAEKIGLLEF